MRRCYRGAAFVIGGFLMTGFTSFNSCRIGTLTAYAAEDTLTEEITTAFQEEVQIGEENVETQAQETAAETQAAQEAIATPTLVAGSSFSLAEQEYQVLLKIVEAEAGGEDSTGKLLVANVVMNRVKDSSFPNSVSEVVYQRHNGKAQFSPIDDGRIHTVTVSEETVEAVGRAMNGEDASAGALFFRSVHSKSKWFDNSLQRVVEHGNHIFYTS